MTAKIVSMILIQEGVNIQKVILMQVFLLLDLPDILPYFIKTVSLLLGFLFLISLILLTTVEYRIQ